MDVGIVPAFGKSKNGVTLKKRLEGDFVCNRASERLCIQSPYSEEQEIKPYRLIGDSFAKIIVAKDLAIPHYDDNGMLILSVCDFLLEDDWMR